MKKLLLGLVVSLGIALAAPLSVGASVSAAQNFVEGTVTVSGKVTRGAKVYVTCNNRVKRDTTATNGTYSVKFNTKLCPVGSPLTVSAQKGNKSGGTTTHIVSGTTTANVALTSSVAVPEFNPIVGMSTALAVGGGLVVIRRRQVGQN